MKVALLLFLFLLGLMETNRRVNAAELWTPKKVKVWRSHRVGGRREQALPFFSGRLTWKSTLWLRLEAITLGVRFKTFVCQHDRREQGCNLMRGQREWETQHGRSGEERGLLSGARTRRRALTGGRHPPGSSSHPIWGWIHLQPKRKLLSSLTFLFSSKDAHPLFQRLYQFNWHDCVGSCRCRKYCKHVIAGLDLRSNKSTQIFQTWHLLHPGRAHCSGRGRCEFFRTGNQQLVPAATGSKEQVFIWGKSFRWYIYIYKAPKKSPSSDSPPTFLVRSPSKTTRHSMLASHAHAGPEAKQTVAI